MVTIGVVGHRVLAEPDRIEAGIETALRQVERTFGGPMTVVSSLAEGADRLVAWHVLARPDARLVVPLPLERDEFIADFGTADSRREFLELLGRASEVLTPVPAATRDGAYEAAARLVLDRCTVLIAVWDGQQAQGRGGTGALVEVARARGRPIAWVHAGNRVPGTMEPTSLGDAQGTVTFENFS